MRHVIVVTLTAEWLAAAFHSAFLADGSSLIRATSNCCLAARHSVCFIARSVFDLAESTHVIATGLDARPKIRLRTAYGQRVAVSSHRVAEWRSLHANGPMSSCYHSSSF